MEAGNNVFHIKWAKRLYQSSFDDLPRTCWNTVCNFLFKFSARNDATEISFNVYQYISSIKNFYGLKISTWHLACLVVNKFNNGLSSAFCFFHVHEKLELLEQWPR